MSTSRTAVQLSPEAQACAGWFRQLARTLRVCRLYKTAPVNNNLVLAYVGEHVLGMPRSY